MNANFLGKNNATFIIDYASKKILTPLFTFVIFQILVACFFFCNVNLRTWRGDQITFVSQSPPNPVADRHYVEVYPPDL